MARGPVVGRCSQWADTVRMLLSLEPIPLGVVEHDCRAVRRENHESSWFSGGGGIRTPGSLPTTADFKSAALNHSATPPSTAIAPSSLTREAVFHLGPSFPATSPLRVGELLALSRDLPVWHRGAYGRCGRDRQKRESDACNPAAHCAFRGPRDMSRSAAMLVTIACAGGNLSHPSAALHDRRFHQSPECEYPSRRAGPIHRRLFIRTACRPRRLERARACRSFPLEWAPRKKESPEFQTR